MWYMWANIQFQTALHNTHSEESWPSLFKMQQDFYFKIFCYKPSKDGTLKISACLVWKLNMITYDDQQP